MARKELQPLFQTRCFVCLCTKPQSNKYQVHQAHTKAHLGSYLHAGRIEFPVCNTTYHVLSITLQVFDVLVLESYCPQLYFLTALFIYICIPEKVKLRFLRHFPPKLCVQIFSSITIRFILQIAL